MRRIRIAAYLMFAAVWLIGVSLNLRWFEFDRLWSTLWGALVVTVGACVWYRVLRTAEAEHANQQGEQHGEEKH